RRVLARCLKKDPKERLHDIGDARIELFEKDAPVVAAGPPPMGSPTRGARALPWAVAGVALLLAAIFGAAAARKGTGRASDLRLAVLPPEGTRSAGPIELSPDGTKLAFTAAGADGKWRLYWRSLDAAEAKVLNGTEGAEAPFWSPDGASIGFFAGKKLKRIAVAGGPTRELTDVPGHRGGSWGAKGVIIFAREGGGPIVRIPAEGGTPVAVTTLEKEETSHRWPHFLPDGERFLFLSRKPKPPHRLVVEAATLDGGRRTPITDSATSGLLHAGRLLYVRESSLLSQAIDEKTFAVSGEPLVLADDVYSSQTEMDGLTAFSVARDGTLAYRRGGNPKFQMVWKDRDGKTLGTVGRPGFGADPSLASDGTHVFFDVSDPANSTANLVSMEVETGRETRLSFGTANDLKPLLSPDGQTIVFSSDVRGPFDVYRMDAAGLAPSPLVANGSWKYAESWSPDGRFVSFRQVDTATKSDIWVQPLAGGEAPRPIARTPANEENSAFSPDGHFIAYDTDESGGREVVVQPVPATGAKWQVSVGGGSAPAWAAGARELYYVSGDGQIMAVPIVSSSNSALSLGSPRALFPTSASTNLSGVQYAVAPDGKRFLMSEPVSLELASPIVVMVPGGGRGR
ncbi:MAG: hypothetical protein ABIT01_03125, partial [Thermoanaerobaculia bacterium]